LFGPTSARRLSTSGESRPVCGSTPSFAQTSSAPRLCQATEGGVLPSAPFSLTPTAPSAGALIVPLISAAPRARRGTGPRRKAGGCRFGRSSPPVGEQQSRESMLYCHLGDSPAARDPLT